MNTALNAIPIRYLGYIPEGFDWFRILEALTDGATITNEQSNKLVEMAGKWPACACGQLCQLLPRRAVDKAPIDGTLNQLGHQFYVFIKAERWEYALRTMQRIEARSIRLLNDIEKRRPAASHAHSGTDHLTDWPQLRYQAGGNSCPNPAGHQRA